MSYLLRSRPRAAPDKNKVDIANICTYLAKYAQPLHHLLLHRLQRPRPLGRYRRVARRDIVPGDLAQRVREALVEYLLELRRARARRRCRVARR